jgi:hypothetical protein
MSLPTQLLWIEPDAHSQDALARFMASNKTLAIRAVPCFVSSLQEALDAFSQGTYEAVVLEPLLLAQSESTVQNAFLALPLIFYTQAFPAEFMPMARHYGVHRVMVKHLPFDQQDFYTQLERCLARTLPAPPVSPLVEMTLKSGDDMIDALTRIESQLENILDMEGRMEMCTPLVEAITNAVYHAPRTMHGTAKYQKGQHIQTLDASEYVQVSLHITPEAIHVCVRDHQGSLTPQQVLQGIAKNYFEEGLYDESGRGFFLMYCLMDEFRLHIVPGYTCDLHLVKYRNVPEPTLQCESLKGCLEESGFLESSGKVKPLIITIGDPLAQAIQPVPQA